MDRTLLVNEFEGFVLKKGPWELFMTVTFRGRRDSFSAKKSFRHFFKYLNYHGKVFFEKYIICFVSFEKDTRGGVHIHALIRGISSLYAKALEEKSKRFFGESKVYPYDPDKGATSYLSKNYGTQALDDFDYIKINSGLRKSKIDTNTIKYLLKDL